MRDGSKARGTALKVTTAGTQTQSPRIPTDLRRVDTVGAPGRAPTASLTSGWARALVSSTAHAAGEEGGTPGNDAPPLFAASSAPGTGLSFSLARFLLGAGLLSRRGLFCGLPPDLTWSSPKSSPDLGGRKLSVNAVEKEEATCCLLPELSNPAAFTA